MERLYLKFSTQLIEIIPRTEDVSSFRFNKPPNLTYLPGQYLLVFLKSNGKEIMHPFSFSSNPTEDKFIEFTKKFSNSEYSSTLKSLKNGDTVNIDASYGDFVFTGQFQKICLLAGGIGITPFWSICNYCSEKKLTTDIILLYSNRNESDIAFYEELKQLQTKNPNLKVLFVLTQANSTWSGLTGRLNSDLIKNQVPDYKERIFFACGPPIMVDAMKNAIAELNLPKTQLKLESLIGHT